MFPTLSLEQKGMRRQLKKTLIPVYERRAKAPGDQERGSGEKCLPAKVTRETGEDESSKKERNFVIRIRNRCKQTYTRAVFRLSLVNKLL